MKKLLTVACTFMLCMLVHASYGQQISYTDITGNEPMCSGETQIQQFKVSGTGLRGGIAVSISSYSIDVSKDGERFFGSVSLPLVNGEVPETTIYVRHTSDRNGSRASGSIKLAATDVAPQYVPVKFLSYREPVYDLHAHHFRHNDTVPTFQLYQMHGGAGGYKWYTDDTYTGFPSSGQDYIPSFVPYNTTRDTIDVPVVITPESRNKAFIPTDRNMCYVVSLDNGELLDSTSTNADPTALVVGRSTEFAYVVSEASDKFNTIHLLRSDLFGTHYVGNSPTAIAVDSEEDFVFTANKGSNTVSIYDLYERSNVETSLSGEPGGLVIDPEDAYLYVSTKAGVVDVIQVATRQLVSSIPVGTQSAGIAISRDGSRVYVANQGSNSLSVIDTNTRTVVNTIALAEGPVGVTVGPSGDRAYVSHPTANTVSVVDTKSGAVVTTIAVAGSPRGITAGSDGAYVYVTSYETGDLTRIDTQTLTAELFATVPGKATALGDFITPMRFCTWEQDTFLVRVAPKPYIETYYTPVTGEIEVCESVASSYPNVQRTVLSGRLLKGNVSVSVPAGFEVSTDSLSGYSSSLDLAIAGDSLLPVPVYVRAGSQIPVGLNTGSLIIRTDSLPDKEVAIEARVYQAPMVNDLPDITVEAGTTVYPEAFTGTALQYAWSTDNGQLGLVSKGIGNLPSFTPTNSSDEPITATITVRPIQAREFTYIQSNHSAQNYINMYAPDTKELKHIVPTQYYTYSSSADGNYLYGGNRSLQVMDTRLGQIIKDIELDDRLAAKVVDVRGLIYIAHGYRRYLSVVNPITYEVVKKISIKESAHRIRYYPEIDKLLTYSQYSHNNSLCLIDPVTSERHDFNLGRETASDAYDPRTNKVFLTQRYTPEMHVVDLNDKAVRTITLPNAYASMFFSEATNKVYLMQDAEVLVFDPDTETITDSLPNVENLSFQLFTFRVSPDGKTLYYLTKDFDIAAYDLINKQVIHTLPRPGSHIREPQYVSMDSKVLYVERSRSDLVPWVVTYDTETFEPMDTIALSTNPGFIKSHLKYIEGCEGTAKTFTVHVLPGPTVVAGEVSDTILTCQGSVSGREVQQIRLSGRRLTSGLRVHLAETSPFELALSVTGPYGSTLTLAPNGEGIVAEQSVYVRVKEGQAPGTLSDKVTLTAEHAEPVGVAIHAIVGTSYQLNASLPAGTLEEAYEAFVLAGDTVSAEPLDITVSGLPNGLEADAYGRIYGTPTDYSGSPYTVTVSIGGYCGVSKAYSLAIGKKQAQVTIINTQQIYNGSPQRIVARTDPRDLEVTVTYFDMDGQAMDGEPVNAGAYPVRVDVITDPYTGIGEDTLYISRATQRINFESVETQYLANEYVVLHASATSGLPVQFSVVRGDNARISADTLYFTLADSVIIEAAQLGDGNYEAVSVRQTVLIQDKSPVDDMRAYPNPTATGKLFIDVGPSKELYTLQIYDTTGRPVRTVTIQGSQFLDVSDIPPGSYTVHLSSDSSAKSVRVVIE